MPQRDKCDFFPAPGFPRTNRKQVVSGPVLTESVWKETGLPFSSVPLYKDLVGIAIAWIFPKFVFSSDGGFFRKEAGYGAGSGYALPRDDGAFF